MPVRERDLRAELDSYRSKYRRVFPAYTFFLDVDPAEHAVLTHRILAHGARVEPCFSSRCTHFVTRSPPLPLARADPNIPLPAPHAKDLVSQAARMNMRIWARDSACAPPRPVLHPVRSLACIHTLTAHPQSSSKSSTSLTGPRQRSPPAPPPRTSTPCSQPKSLPTPPARPRYEMPSTTSPPHAQANGYDYAYDAATDQYVLTGMYAPLDPQYATLLVEDATQACRPVYLEMFAYPGEGEIPPWPVLYNDGEGRCPFSVPSVTRRKQEPSPNAWRTLRNVLDHDEAIALATDQGLWDTPTSDALPEGVGANESPRTPGTPPSAWLGMDIHASAASGVPGLSSKNTTSTAANTDPASTLTKRPADPRMRALQRRPMFSPAPSPAPTQGAVRALMALRASGTPSGPRRRKDKKPGYCENCRVKFDDLEEHATTRRHLRFAQNDQNFEEIDALLDSVARVLLP